jgi:hypothetical protein
MSGGGVYSTTHAAEEPDARAPELPPPRSRGIRVALPALTAISLLGVEVDSAWRMLNSNGPLTAQPARFEVLVFAAVAAAVAAVALVARVWARRFAALGPAVIAAVVLAATATLGGQAAAMLATVLAVAASWCVGEQLLRWLGAGGLAERAIVSWLAGLGPLCLLTLLLGRLSLFKWWTMGIVVLLVGGLGCVRAARALWTRRALIASEVAGSSLSAASTGVIVLTIAIAAVYTAAPEIQFDALYGKAYLPMLWARTGTIGALNGHVQLNIAGWFQLVASWGNLLGAPATGRYLQLAALVAAPAVVWSWARRFASLGPLAAVAVAITPTLFWQATTADDDLLLALAVFALTVAVFESLQPSSSASDRAIGLALGLMAGTGISLKSHLIPISVALLVGWMVSGGRSRIGPRILYGTIGALITAAPPLVLRWSDTGNPVFPAYNNIFKSPYWLPINEKFNFPFWPHPGVLGPLKAIWDSMVSPLGMQEAAPPGSFGALIGIVLVALLVGWRYRRRTPGSFVLWIAIVIAVAAWWMEFRYLRYLLPAAFASVVLVLATWRPAALGSTARASTVVAVAVAAAASFPVSVAQFWNVPNRRVPISAAIGRWAASDYLDTALPERDAILAFNSLSPPHSVMVTDAFERDWLTQGRDLDATWELNDLFQLHGRSVPTSGNAAYARMKAMSVNWALVTGPDRVISGSTWLAEVLHTHGQPRFSAEGWDLYQIVDHPTPPAPLASCDDVAAGLSHCWAGPRTAGNEAGGAMTRTVAVCPGQELAVTVSENRGGPVSTVLIQFPGASAHSAVASGEIVPGAAQPTDATVPAGSHQAVITLDPLSGAQITKAIVARFGAPCTG